MTYHRHTILQVHCNLHGPLSTKGCDENESVFMAMVFGFVWGWGDEMKFYSLSPMVVFHSIFSFMYSGTLVTCIYVLNHFVFLIV